ncbi:MAG TPA: GAF and ANTAR domain-containing protein [Jatrophihabitans sp.]
MTEPSSADAGAVLGTIATQFGDLARSMIEQHNDEHVITRVVQFAAQGVPGAEHVGLSVVAGEQPPNTFAATSQLPVQIDGLQQIVGEGPCLQALIQSDIARADDLAADQQWPRFAAAAVTETGIRSMLSMRLYLSGNRRAALSFYATKPHAFDDVSIATAAIFAAYASLIQLNVLHQDKAMHLERALESNREIGTAIGILMARKLLTSEQAFDQLRVASQNLHRKLRDVADEVKNTGELPHYQPLRS